MSYLSRANRFIVEKNFEAAETLLKKALKENPKFYIYYLKLAMIFSMTNRLEEAEKHVMRAWELNNNSLTLSYVLDLQSKLGKNIIEVVGDERTELSEFKKRAASNIESLKRKLNFYVPRYKYLQLFSPALSLANFGRKALEIKSELKSDVYLSLLPNSLSAAFNLADAFGEGKIICDNVENVDRDKHSLPPSYSPQVMRIYNQMCYGAQMQCDKLMTVSNALAKDLKRFSKPTLTLINSRAYERIIPSNKLKEKFGLNDDARIVFASGNAVSGFEPILEALAGLPENYILIGFIRVKPDSYFEKIKSLILELNLTHRVFINDFVPYEELIDFAQQAHVGVTIADESNPNAAVALPNRFFDYLCAEIPIVMHAMPDVVELTRKYNIGKTVYKTTAENWRLAIEEVVENQALYKPNVRRAKSEICWESQEKELYEFMGKPTSVTMFGIRDLTQYQRFKRIAKTLINYGCKVKMFTLSKATEYSAVIPGVDYYIINDLNDPDSKATKLDFCERL